MQAILDRLVKVSPVPAMVRIALESILSPDSIDEIFRTTATMQTQRQLLFSSIVHLMCLVVCRIKPSVNASYVYLEESFSVSVKSVYNKINKVEPEVSRELVFRTAGKVKEVIGQEKGLGVNKRNDPFPLFLLDRYRFMSHDLLLSQFATIWPTLYAVWPSKGVLARTYLSGAKKIKNLDR